MRCFVMFLAFACAGERPDPTDTASPPDCWAGPADLQVSQDPTAIDGPLPDDVLLYGTPPQGGAPYAPLYVRLRGVPESASTHFELSCTDAQTGEVLGLSTYDPTLLCANAGPHAGWWVGSSLHLRFGTAETPRTLDELADRAVVLTVRAGPPESPVTWTQRLTMERLPEP